MAALSWHYPQDELIALRRRQDAAAARRPIASRLAVEKLNFHYRISGDEPAWRPLRAFDDGRQTFIEFPPSIAVGEAPPLFVIGRSEEHTSELQSLMRISSAVFCLTQKNISNSSTKIKTTNAHH